MFIYLVNVMNGMAGGRIVGVVFFICVTFAGVSSIINLYEAPVAFLQEQFGMKRLPATASSWLLGSCCALYSGSCIELDGYCINLSLPVRSTVGGGILFLDRGKRICGTCSKRRNERTNWFMVLPSWKIRILLMCGNCTCGRNFLWWNWIKVC